MCVQKYNIHRERRMRTFVYPKAIYINIKIMCMVSVDFGRVSSTKFTRYKFLCFLHDLSYNIRCTNALILSILLPASPPSLKCTSFLRYPPLGLDSLNGHKKLFACLKFGPQVYNSWIKSSTQAIPLPPSWPSMILLSVKAILCLFTLP